MAPQNDPHWCHQEPWKCQRDRLGHHDPDPGGSTVTWTDDGGFNGDFKRAENPFHFYFFIIFIGLLGACIVGFCFRFYVMFRTICIKQQQLHHRFVATLPIDSDNTGRSRHFYQRHHDNHSEPSTPSPPPSSSSLSPFDQLRPGRGGGGNIGSWTLPIPNMVSHAQGPSTLASNLQVITSSRIASVAAVAPAPAPIYNSSMAATIDDPPPTYEEAVLIGQQCG